MNITELSKKYDISVRTIRYYEEIGIIKSSRTERNIRQYDDDNADKLILTLILKELNIKLKDIKKIVGGSSESSLRNILKTEHGKLENQMVEIVKKKRLISSLVNSYGSADINKQNIKEFMRQQLYVSTKNERLTKILMGNENITVEIGEKLIPIASKEENSLLSAVKDLRKTLAENEDIHFDKIRIRDNIVDLKSYEFWIIKCDEVVVKKEVDFASEQEKIDDIISNLRKHIKETE